MSRLGQEGMHLLSKNMLRASVQMCYESCCGMQQGVTQVALMQQRPMPFPMTSSGIPTSEAYGCMSATLT